MSMFSVNFRSHYYSSKLSLSERQPNTFPTQCEDYNLRYRFQAADILLLGQDQWGTRQILQSNHLSRKPLAEVGHLPIGRDQRWTRTACANTRDSPPTLSNQLSEQLMIMKCLVMKKTHSSLTLNHLNLEVPFSMSLFSSGGQHPATPIHETKFGCWGWWRGKMVSWSADAFEGWAGWKAGMNWNRIKLLNE